MLTSPRNPPRENVMIAPIAVVFAFTGNGEHDGKRHKQVQCQSQLVRVVKEVADGYRRSGL